MLVFWYVSRNESVVRSGDVVRSGRDVAGRAFLIVWPPAQLGSLPIPAALSRPALHGETETSAGRARVAALRGRR